MAMIKVIQNKKNMICFIYIILLTYLLIFCNTLPIRYHYTYNIIPFHTIYEYLFLNTINKDIILKYFLINFLILTPLAGFIDFRNRIGHIFIIVFTFLSEILQYILNCGYMEIDDIIL